MSVERVRRVAGAATGVVVESLVAGLAVGSPGVPVDAARGYDIEVLGVSSLDYSIATGLNDLGDVVGYNRTLSLLPLTDAWVWRDGEFADLPVPASVRYSAAADINNAGIIVGSTQADLGQPLEGCYWGLTGAFSAMGSPEAVPRAVTDNLFSSFAGSDYSGVGEQPAVMVLGGSAVLPLTMGTVGGRAWDLNSSNDVVGYTTDSGFHPRAVLWPGGGAPVVAPTPGLISQAMGINDAGAVVGTYRVGDGSSPLQNRGFRWEPGVGFQTYASAGFYDTCEAYAISPRGVAVGGSRESGLDDYLYGTVWDFTDAYLLNDLTPRRNSIDIGEAVAINAGGEIIARGIRGDGLFTEVEVAVLLYPKNGRVDYRETVYAPTGETPRGVVAADFDGDGDPDVAVACEDAEAVWVYRNDGGGGLAFVRSVATQGAPYGLRAVNLNNSGGVDLVIGTDEGVGTAINLGGLQFTLPTGSYFDAAPFAWGVAPVDVNRDGFADIAAARFFSDEVVFYTNDGAGRMTEAYRRPTGARPRFIDSADINGDGRPDVVTGDQFGGITVIRSFSSGYDATPDSYGDGPDMGPVRIADVNNDGHADVVGVREDTLGVFINTGNGTFFPGRDYIGITQYFGLGTVGVELEDMDLDGDPDVVVGVGSARFVRTLANRGSGVMRHASVDFVLDDGRLGAVDVADMNGDGTPDVVAVDRTTGRVAVVLNDATPPEDVPPGCNPSDMAPPYDTIDLADINAFIASFTAQDPLSDIAEPFGVLDLADVNLFVTSFTGGCD